MDAIGFFGFMLILAIGLVFAILPLVIGWRTMTAVERIANLFENQSGGLKNEHTPD